MRPITAKPLDNRGTFDPGPAPMLQWIEVERLVIDDNYQRDLKPGNWKAIRRIAGQFRWSRFSPVFVAPVEGGLFAVIDGQHRTHAAVMCGLDRVPCQVVQMTEEEQAAAFAAINGLVTKVTTWNIYKASLAAGEQWALDCAKACEDAGCILRATNKTASLKQPGEIYAIKLIHGHVKAGSGQSVTLALSGLRRSAFGSEAPSYANEVLKPLFIAVADRPWLAKRGEDLSGFMDAFDMWAALDRAAEVSKQKRREGITGFSKFDFASAEIGEGLDRAFPQRVAIPRAAAG